MSKHGSAAAVLLVTAASVVLVAGKGAIQAAHAHEDHGTYSAGEPGNAKRPARRIEIAMREEYGSYSCRSGSR
jgi:hypothetical protein